MDTGLLLLVITIFALGIGSQIIADKYRVPSIIFLLIVGILAGPEFLGIVDPDAFGEGLQVIVGLAVAIIVFEGAFHLKVRKLKTAQNEAVKLGTIGAVVSCVLTAVAAYYTLNVSWGISFLIGALLIATGPTVIKPILDVVNVRNRVEAALETEGIVNDVTAAILALVVYEFVVIETHSVSNIFAQFVTRWGTGAFIGILAALSAYVLLTKVDLKPDKESQDARIIVLGTALISYGLAELVISEAGIAAVATAGLLLGNLEIPHRKEIQEFEDVVSVIVLSFVFIALTALLTFEDLLALGVGGLLFVLAVTMIIRPITVYSSIQGDRFTSREKMFISIVGPRGIIPASVATLFALELQNLGRTEEAAVLVGSVFLIILTTSFVEGGLAKYAAKKLDVIPMHTIIIGAGEPGLELAQKLENRGENIVIIDNDEEEVKNARSKGFNAIYGDARDPETLEKAEVKEASIVAAMTHEDDVNMVVAQITKSNFDVERIVARVNEPENKNAFKDMGIEIVTSPQAIANAFDNIIENPRLWRQLTEHRDNIEVAEIVIKSEKSMKDLEKDLPEGCAITIVTRGEKTFEPGEVDKVKTNDVITIMGRNKSVKEAIRTYRD